LQVVVQDGHLWVHLQKNLDNFSYLISAKFAACYLANFGIIAEKISPSNSKAFRIYSTFLHLTITSGDLILWRFSSNPGVIGDVLWGDISPLLANLSILCTLNRSSFTILKV